METGKPGQGPDQSMDDILASIQRIITEDPSGAGPVRRAPVDPPPSPLAFVPVDEEEEGEEDVLELTSPLATPTPEPAPPPATPAWASTPAPTPPAPTLATSIPAAPVAVVPPTIERTADWPAFLSGPIPATAPLGTAAEPVPTIALAPAPTPAPAPASRADQRDPLLSDRSARASREALAALSSLLVAPPSAAGPPTLEDLVREMLRPMLKDWLDERLPSLVEDMVAREIARITRGD